MTGENIHCESSQMINDIWKMVNDKCRRSVWTTDGKVGKINSKSSFPEIEI
jgi:hypothetical protein